MMTLKIVYNSTLPLELPESKLFLLGETLYWRLYILRAILRKISLSMQRKNITLVTIYILRAIMHKISLSKQRKNIALVTIY